MRNILILAMTTLLMACLENSDGSSRSTYSSCKITQSNALYNSDKANDLKQCWNLPNGGYESKGDAMQFCAQKVAEYMSNTYLMGHSVTYMAESTYCPS